MGNLTQKIEDAAKKLEDTIANIKKRDKTLNDLAQGFSLMIGFAKAAQTQDSGKVQAFIAGQIP